VKLILAVNERIDEQRCIMKYLDSFSLKRDLRQARLVSLPLASLGDFVREPHKGMISHKGTMLQSAAGEGMMEAAILAKNMRRKDLEERILKRLSHIKGVYQSQYAR